MLFLLFVSFIHLPFPHVVCHSHQKEYLYKYQYYYQDDTIATTVDVL